MQLLFHKTSNIKSNPKLWREKHWRKFFLRNKYYKTFRFWKYHLQWEFDAYFLFFTISFLHLGSKEQFTSARYSCCILIVNTKMLIYIVSAILKLFSRLSQVWNNFDVLSLYCYFLHVQAAKKLSRTDY